MGYFLVFLFYFYLFNFLQIYLNLFIVYFHIYLWHPRHPRREFKYANWVGRTTDLIKKFGKSECFIVSRFLCPCVGKSQKIQ